jgi:hypothetical protein
MFSLALKLLLLISPILYIPGIVQNMLDMSFFKFSVILLFLLSSKEKAIRDIPFRLYRYIFLFLSLLLVNISTHLFSAIDTAQASNIFLGVLLFVLIFKYVDNPRIYYKYIVFGAVINIIAYYIQLAGFNFIKNIGSDEYYGGYMFTNIRLTTYLSVILPFLNPVLMFLSVLSIFFIKDIQIVILVPAFIYLVVKFYKNKILLIFFSILFIVGIIFFQNNIKESLNVRYRKWNNEVFPAIKEHPVLFSIIGYGAGYPRGQEGITPNVDPAICSSHLQFIICYGIYGLLLYMFFWFMFFKNFNLSKNDLSVLNIFIIGFVEYPFEILKLTITIIFILSSMIISRIEKVNNNV